MDKKPYIETHSYPIEIVKDDDYLNNFFVKLNLNICFLDCKVNILSLDLDPEFKDILLGIFKVIKLLPIRELISYYGDYYKVSDESLDDLLKSYASSSFVDIKTLTGIGSFVSYVELVSESLGFLYSGISIHEISNFFTYLDRNLDFKDRFGNLCIQYLQESIDLSRIDYNLEQSLIDPKTFVDFFKKQTYFYFISNLNYKASEGYGLQNDIDIQNLDLDEDFYVTFIEFLFDQNPSISIPVHECIYEIVNILEIKQGYMINNHILTKLFESRYLLSLDKIVFIERYQNITAKNLELLVPLEVWGINKYQEPIFYGLLVEIMLDCNFYMQDLSEMLRQNVLFVEDYIARYIYALPDLLKNKVFKRSFSGLNLGKLSHSFASIVMESELSCKDKFIKVFEFNKKKRNHSYISLMIKLVSYLEFNQDLVVFIDLIFNLSDHSNVEIKRLTSFLNLIGQVMGSLGDEKFTIFLRQFMFKDRVYDSLADMIYDFRLFIASQLCSVASDQNLQTLSRQPSKTSNIIVNMLSNLLGTDDSIGFTHLLMDANTAGYNDSFLDYKYPVQFDIPSALKSGNMISLNSNLSLRLADNFQDFLYLGKFPVETCLSFDQKLTHRNLISYIVEPNVGVWYFEKAGRLVAKRIMILAEMNQKPTLLAMPIYTNLSNNLDLRIIENLTVKYAALNSLDLIIYDLSSGFHPKMTSVLNHESSSYNVSLFQTRSNDFKFDFMKNPIQVSTPNQNGLYELNTVISGYYFPS